MKFGTLGLVVAPLVLTACHSPPPVAVAPPTVLPAQGIDLPTDASDALNEIRDSKIDFVARYYRNPTSRWPALTAGEAQRLSSLGVKIVTVWEWHSHDPGYFSYRSGYEDARSAYAQAKAIGQPPGSAIYFAVDYNAPSADIDGSITQYFHGVAAGLAASGGGTSEYRVGVYGSGAVCDVIKRSRLAQYAWLTSATAWSGTLDYNDWNIRQGGHFSVLSFDHDSDEAQGDYGGFQIAGVAPVPGNAPAPSDVSTPYDTTASRDVIPPPAPPEGPAPVEGQWRTTRKMSSL